MTTCLVCDGDPAALAVTAEHLTRYDVRVIAVGTLAEIRSCLSRTRVDAVLVEAMLPDGDGIQFCNVIRSASDVPLLVVTAQDDSVNRILALEMGADDFIGKPFDPRELIARIRAVVRRRVGSLSSFPVRQNDRREAPDARSTMIRFGGMQLRIDWLDRQICHSSGEIVTVSAVEIRLLVAFTESPGVVLSRASLIDHAKIASGVRDRAIDLSISRLRGKLGDVASRPAIIATVRGHGYRLLAQVDNSMG